MNGSNAALLARLEKRVRLDNFFTGPIYPLIVTGLALVGALTGYEVYINILLSVLTFVALMCSRTIRPFLPYLLVALYQIPEEHLITDPAAGGDYLFSGARMYIVFGSIALVLLGVLIFLIRHSIRKQKEAWHGEYKRHMLPLLIPTLLFCVSFIFAGFGTDGFLEGRHLLYTFGQSGAFLLLFAVIYRGISDEDSEELLRYFAYISFLVALVINTQVVIYHYEKYLETGALEFIRSGWNEYPEISLGFGGCNLVAFNVGAFIPMQMYGFVKCRGRLLYLFGAICSCILAVSCVSRTATVASTLFLIIGFISAFFARDISEKRRRTNRILLGIVTVAILAFIVIFPGKVKMLYQDMFDRLFVEEETSTTASVDIEEGNADETEEKEEGEMHLHLTGRDKLWQQAFEGFRTNPIFGVGPAHVEVDEWYILSADFFPYMAHNTAMQLLGSGGLVALVAYLIYRISTLVVFFRDRSTNKWFLFLVSFYLIVTSILDNYIFYIYTTFPYVIALAIACKIYRERGTERRRKRERLETIREQRAFH